ncbi:UBX domain-containing protein 11 [Conger conger]|uniref:UBX domain-containing protein 11 n=1 Tax=Conger conger TaxID=82655 RepID=UPI002A5AB101|nr:UBX domain-containing protein 11 [Conger conger]
MSSPLSVLGKNRRAPLHAARHQGQRRGPFKEKPCAGSGLSDFELMSTMMEKHRLLEKKVFSQSIEIQNKDKKIAVLQEKLRALQEKMSSSAPHSEPGVLLQDMSESRQRFHFSCCVCLCMCVRVCVRVCVEEAGGGSREEELEQTCHTLQNQVWEMERFLNDYDMVWVGNRGVPQEEAQTKQEVWRGPLLQQPDVPGRQGFQMNFDLVVRCVQELNVVAGEGVSHVQLTPGGARLAQRPSIPLTLYSNGIVLFHGPFRPYHDPSTQQCMLDLMDGYFPSELQEQFPDGVPFQVTDRREEEFKERPVGAEFPGEGKAVGGAESNGHAPRRAVHDGHAPRRAVHDGHAPRRAVHDGHAPRRAVHDGHAPRRAVHDTHQSTGGKLSMEQFLNKLPQTVIKAGRVIDIRASLKADMQNPTCTQTIIETPALQNPRSPGDDVIVLKVRVEDGQSFILRMLPSETVGQLRNYLDTHRGPGTEAYDIISTFPSCRYDNRSQTLRACGLTSNTTLLLRPHHDPSRTGFKPAAQCPLQDWS